MLHVCVLQESLTVCRRRSQPWLLPRWRSRSSLPQRGSTPYGLVAPSWPPCPPSSRCGSPNRSTTSPAPPSCTGSASKQRMRVSAAAWHEHYTPHPPRGFDQTHLASLASQGFSLICRQQWDFCSELKRIFYQIKNCKQIAKSSQYFLRNNFSPVMLLLFVHQTFPLSSIITNCFLHFALLFCDNN